MPLAYEHKPQPDEGLRTSEQAAEYLNVSPRWLEERVQRGMVPHRRLGRLVRFAPEDLAEIVAEARRGASDE